MHVLFISYYFPQKIRTGTAFFKKSVPVPFTHPTFERILPSSFSVPCFHKNDPYPFCTVLVFEFQSRPVYVAFPISYMGTGTEHVRIPFPYSGVWFDSTTEFLCCFESNQFLCAYCQFSTKLSQLSKTSSLIVAS